MNLFDVATEISARLQTIPGLLQTNIGPPRSVSPPCSVIPLPEGTDYHGTYNGGMTRVANWQIFLLAGHVDDEECFARIAGYAAESGESSVRAALESTDPLLFDPYTSCHVVTVKSCTFEVVTWQEADFQGAIFTIDVVGTGSA